MRAKDPVFGRQSGSVLLGLVLVWLVVPSLTSAQVFSFIPSPHNQVMVADIQVVGNHSVSSESILNRMMTRAGAEFLLSVLEDDVRTLLALGSFRNVKSRVFPADSPWWDGREYVHIVIEVEDEASLIEEVEIKANRHAELNNMLHFMGIERGAAMNPSRNEYARTEIETQYRDHGYYFATVTLEEGTRAADKRVVFHIKEGPLVRVRHIEFDGNDSLASSVQLATLIPTSKNMITTRGSRSVFKPELLDLDLEALEKCYHDNGYLDVKVSVEKVFGPKGHWVDLIYHIREGVQYRVKHVKVEGIPPQMQARAESIVQLKPGDIYKVNIARQDTDNLINLMGWQGYQVQVRELLYCTEPGQIEVRYEVYDPMQRPCLVGAIKIEGNSVTKDRVIRRLVGLHPGQILPFPAIPVAEKALARSKRFQVNPKLGIRPTIEVLDDPNNPGSEFKDILIHVDEKHTDEKQTGSFLQKLHVAPDTGMVSDPVPSPEPLPATPPPMPAREDTSTTEDPDSPVKIIEVHVDPSYIGILEMGVHVQADSGLVGTIVLNEGDFDVFCPTLSQGSELGVRFTRQDPNSANRAGCDFTDILSRFERECTGSFRLGLGVNSSSGLVGDIVLNERNFDLFRPEFGGAADSSGMPERGHSARPPRLPVGNGQDLLFGLPGHVVSWICSAIDPQGSAMPAVVVDQQPDSVTIQIHIPLSRSRPDAESPPSQPD
jgi:outer membrane protein insertion porin family